jgi:hypothetical protein
MKVETLESHQFADLLQASQLRMSITLADLQIRNQSSQHRSARSDVIEDDVFIGACGPSLFFSN